MTACDHDWQPTERAYSRRRGWFWQCRRCGTHQRGLAKPVHDTETQRIVAVQLKRAQQAHDRYIDKLAGRVQR